MNILDVRTIIFSQFVTDLICTAVLLVLWFQNRRRFNGISYWIIDFSFQTIGIGLIMARGSLPDWVSMGVANLLVVGGALLGFLGLVRFTGRKSSQIHNLILLGIFILAQSYFIFFRPSLQARNLNLSLALLLICFQCAWLMLSRAGRGGQRQSPTNVGIVFGLFCLVSLVRIAVELAVKPQNNDVFRSDVFETLTLQAYQVLLILLCFSLTLLVNDNLIEDDLIQKEKFSKAFHSSPFAITLTRASDGLILEANESFLEATGYSSAEVTGKSTLDLGLWARDTDCAWVVEELTNRRPILKKEFELQKKSGEQFTSLFTADLIALGDQPCILSNFLDISENKQAEKALQKSSHRFQNILSSLYGGILVLEESDRVEFVNQSFCDLFDLKEPPDSLVGLGASEILQRTGHIYLDQTGQLARIQEIVEMKQPLKEEEIGITGGRTYIRDFIPILIDGKPSGSLWNFRDITERKQNEASILESELRYRHTLDAMLEGCQVLGFDWRYLYINDAAERQNRRSREELLGQRYMDMWPGIRSKRVFRLLKKCMEERIPQLMENQFVFPDGSEGYFELRISPVPEGIAILSIDITARKQAEAEIADLARFPAENPNPVMRIHRDGTLLYANPASALLVETLGCGIGQKVPEDWQEMVTGACQSGENVEVINPIARWLYSFLVNPVRQAGYVNVYGLDITDRKRTEDTLLESENRYRSLFENMLNGLAYCHMLFEDGRPEDFIYLAVNNAFQKLTGLQDVVGRKVSEVIPGIRQSDPKIFELYASVAMTGQPESVEVYVEALKMWFSISVYSPQKEYFVAIFDVITQRKEMEAALQESETNFRTLAENAGEGILVATEKGVHLFANQAIAEISGYSTSELLGLNARDLSDPADSDMIMQRLVLRLAGEPVPNQYETAIIGKNGLKIPVQINSNPTIWKGRPADIVFIQDITERKLAEEKHQQSETLFRTLFELSPDAIMLIDPDDPVVRSRVIDCNAAACLMNGYRREELVGQSVDIVNLSPYTQDGEISYLEKIRSEGKIQLEVLHRHKNGTVFPVEVSSTMIKVGGRVLLIGMDRDITERKRSEEELKESEERYRELVQNASSAIIRWKNDGTIVFFNEYAEHFFGYRSDEVIGKDINILVPQMESTGGDLSKLVENIIAHPELFDKVVNENICRDGHRVWMAWTNKPVLTLDGRVSEILAVGIDITERKNAEEQLHQTLEELKRSNIELEQFAYVASHDLQEPLRMVSSYVQLLERRYKGRLDQDADEFIAFAVDGAERMRRLINDLLAYSRLGSRAHDFVAISGEAVLSQAIGNLKMAIGESGAIVTHDPLPELIGDEAQLVQLFQNLVGNAIKFRADQVPHVHISAVLRPVSPDAQANRKTGQNEWLFSVRDNGIGIDPQYAERIFIIFQRLQGRNKFEGTGIGLAICRKIVQRHGGLIWVESNLGKGATFFFTLPHKGENPV